MQYSSLSPVPVAHNRFWPWLRGLAVVILLLAGASLSAALEEYKPEERLSGTLRFAGSDSLLTVLERWSVGFREFHPDVSFEIKSDGSGTAPHALTTGAADLGPMSRPMRQHERDEFSIVHGYEPVAVPVAVDGLAVVVNHSNPVRSITVSELHGIYSSAAADADLGHRWEDLANSRQEGPIRAFGRDHRSGTHGFFRDSILGGGTYASHVKPQASSAEVVRAVSADPMAIGYTGVGYLNENVRALAIDRGTGKGPVAPTRLAALLGDYPLTRQLYLYIRRAPNERAEPLVEEFVRYALSAHGQEAVREAGYFRLAPTMAEEALARLSPAGLPVKESAGD